MCFNETASMIVFLGAVYAGLKKYYNSKVNESLFILSISIMQLAEFFVHRSIRLNNKRMLEYSSQMVYFILYIQPLLQGLIHYNYPLTKYMFKDHMKYFVLLFAIYTILVLIMYNLKGDYIITSSNCKNSICRLNWQKLNSNLYIGLSLFLLYVCMHFIFMGPTISLRYLTILLSALLYVLIFDVKNTGNIFGLWGSLWCFFGTASIATGIYKP